MFFWRKQILNLCLKIKHHKRQISRRKWSLTTCMPNAMTAELVAD
jgi:hypothetical protein